MRKILFIIFIAFLFVFLGCASNRKCEEAHDEEEQRCEEMYGEGTEAVQCDENRDVNKVTGEVYSCNVRCKCLVKRQDSGSNASWHVDMFKDEETGESTLRFLYGVLKP